MSTETRTFQAEVQKLLHLMIHSLYSNKDVFLRELISNASDAIDRRRFEGLTNATVQPDEAPSIGLIADPAARTLVVEDDGIGMTREELAQNLGTIARSGTLEYLGQLEENADAVPDLIGQFGVGFYASFMVADSVTVVSRRAGDDKATRWHTDGSGSFTLDEAERDRPGTTITLHLLPEDRDEGLSDYTDEWVLRRIVKRYSDFVAHPIRLTVMKKASDDLVAEPVVHEEPLNSMKAIWTRPAGEVDDADYAEFYTHITHDHNPPLLRVSTALEGTFEAKALLYVPSVAPFDLYHREMARRGIQLYVRRVFIMDECRDLMPDYLRFVKGVVDAEDLSLNVSREMLQQSRPIQVIRNHLVKKVLESLAHLKETDEEKYLRFFGQFGPVLKEGLLSMDEKKDRILELVYAPSTEQDGQPTSLTSYVDRMKEDQAFIYYMSGASPDVLARSPHLEALREKGIEVLLFADPVDDVWLEQMPPEFRGKRFRSVDRGELDLGEPAGEASGEAERSEAAAGFADLLAPLRVALQDDVKEVRLSSRLTSSAACLVRDEGDLSPQLEAMLRHAGQAVPARKPILELNPRHPLLERLREIAEADTGDPRIAEAAGLLHAQAVLADGGQLADPRAFNEKLSELMVKGL